MDQTAIFVPFVGTMMLTFIVWFYMYSRRLQFVLSRKLSSRQMTRQELDRVSPAGVANPSDNLKNLFELPTVFYAVVLYLYATSQVDGYYVLAAWIFFVFRILHSVVHCSFNFVPLRFFLYVISALALWYMVLRVAWSTLPG